MNKCYSASKYFTYIDFNCDPRIFPALHPYHVLLLHRLAMAHVHHLLCQFRHDLLVYQQSAHLLHHCLPY
jgi:hypothetical protein